MQDNRENRAFPDAGENRDGEVKTKEDVMRIVREEDVEFIRLQFTDMFGTLKNIAVTSSQLEKALNNRCMFDGSAIDGFVSVEESDMFLYPDPSTFAILPWRPQQGKVARMLCDVHHPDGRPFAGDPRHVLKKAIEKAETMGLTFEVGPECEFFLFHTDENAIPTTQTGEQASYFDIGPLDEGENARRDIVMALEDMGMIIEASHHEMAPVQHEIDLRYAEALKAADNIMTFKLAARTIAKRHGLHATFMPKPKFGVNGSGMHINMSLHRNGKNIFENKDDVNGLSQSAYYFIGGIMKHIKGMAAITNPLVNSYKRLVPGFAAPVYIAWSATNRSPLIRIPAAAGTGARIELRSPDSAANPYLTLAVCLEAGLDGIAHQIMPPESVDCKIYTMTDQQRRNLKIQQLPGTLIDALEEMRQDPLIMEVLGPHIAENYIAAKEDEWQRYRANVSEWEIREYLYRY